MIFRKPKNIKPGDTIGILSTARAIETEELNPTIEHLQSKNYKVILGTSIGAKHHQFAGDQALRATDLQNMLNRKEIKAVICARGGYGTSQLIEQIDWTEFKNNPKWIIGYSDITALHNTVSTLEIMSLHGIMPININNEVAFQTFEKTLSIMQGNSTFSLPLPNHRLNRPKMTKGILTGGNLSVLYSLRGTPYDIVPEKRILFMEDLDEYLYHIDRMMVNFSLGQIFNKVAAVVIGGMTDMNDNTTLYGATAEEIIYNNIPNNVPLFFGASFGHFDKNEPMVCGATATISQKNNQWTLTYNL